MPPIFVDANIPMYAAGSEHLSRAPSIRVVQLVLSHPETFVTSVEVFQEILHRYLAERSWGQLGARVFQEFQTLMDGRIEPMVPEDTLEMARLANTGLRLQARDFAHAAVMRRLGCTHIVTADRGFDDIPGVERLDPVGVDRWAAELGLLP